MKTLLSNERHRLSMTPASYLQRVFRDLRDKLRAMGYTAVEKPLLGCVNAVMTDPKTGVI